MMDRFPQIHRTEWLQGLTAEERSMEVLDLLERSIDRSGLPRFLYLTPTRRKCRDTEELLRKRMQTWSSPFYVPVELARNVLESEPGRGKTWIAADLKTLLIREILHEAGPESLPGLHFRDRSTPLGVASHIARALEYLARRGLQPRSAGSHIHRSVARDLDYVRQQYHERLLQLDLCDPVDIPLLAAQSLRQHVGSVDGPVDLLVLDGFAALDQGETDFLLALIEYLDTARFAVTVPTALMEAVRQGGWDSLPHELRFYRYGQGFFESLGLLAGSGSGTAPSVVDSQPPPHSRPFLRSSPDRTEEIKGIARTIKRTFSAKGKDTDLAPEDFHIIVPRLDPYYRLFMEIFPRYGIPFNVTRGIPLASIPVVGLVHALIEAVMRRDHESLFRFFGSDLVTPPPACTEDGFSNFLSELASEGAVPINWPNETLEPENDASLDMGILYRACRHMEIPGGPDILADWVIPFDKCYAAPNSHTSEPSSLQEDSRAAREYQALLVQVWMLQREFRELDRVVTSSDGPEGFASGLVSLLSRYGIYRNLVTSLDQVESAIEVGREMVREKNVRGLGKTIEVLEEIGRDLSISMGTAMDVEAFQDLFRRRCRTEMIQEAGELAGVSVSQMLEIRNISRSVVFAAGLTADDFPLPPPANFLIPSGPESYEFLRSLAESHYLLHELLRNSGTVYLSYPRSDRDEPMEISPFIEDLRDAGLVNDATMESSDDALFAPYEILEHATHYCRQGESIPWDKVLHLLASHPATSLGRGQRFEEEMRRLLTAFVQRSRIDTHGPYDGMIADPGMLAAIADQFDSPRFKYSPAMLTEYRRCPLQFFFKRLVKLEPMRDIPEEPDLSVIGNVVHDILAKFYTEVRDSHLKRIHQGNMNEAQSRLASIAEQVIVNHRSLPAGRVETEAVRMNIMAGLQSSESANAATRSDARVDEPSASRNRPGMLRRFLEHEARLNLPLYVESCEFGFGYGQTPPLALTGFGGNEIRIRGRIDRIDFAYESLDARDSEHDRPKAAWIFDYKTGTWPSLKHVRDGQDLQLPVYLLAVRHSLSDRAVTEVGACFLALRDEVPDLRKSLIHTDGIPPELVEGVGRRSWRLSDDDLEQIQESISEIDAAIRAGRFPRTENSAICNVCPYTRACFRDEHRVRILS